MHRDRIGDHFQESGDIRESSSVLGIAAGHLRWKSHLEKIHFEILLRGKTFTIVVRLCCWECVPIVGCRNRESTLAHV